MFVYEIAKFKHHLADHYGICHTYIILFIFIRENVMCYVHCCYSLAGALSYIATAYRCCNI